MTEKNTSQYIICPTCEGTGKNKDGFSCQNCGSLSLGAFFYGQFLYWGLRLGKTAIQMDKLRKKFHKALKITSHIIFSFGLVSLGYWFYGVIANNLTSPLEMPPSELKIWFESFFFWKYKSIFLFIFWISAYAGLFIIYQKSEEKKKKSKIKKVNYEERIGRPSLPNNWEELKKQNLDFKIDVVSGFSDEAMTVVEQAYSLADRLDHSAVEPLHLFFCSLEDKQTAAIFSRLDINAEKLLEMFKHQFAKIEKKKGPVNFSNEAKEALVDAYIQSCELGQKTVSPKNFLISCANHQEIIKEILHELNITRAKIFNVILWFIINERLVEDYRAYKKAAGFKPGRTMDRAYTAVATPTLNGYAYDLTLAAKWGKLDYCVSREKEIKNIFQAIQSGHNGVILVGLPGVGKETVVDGIAELMVMEDVPKYFQDKRLVELDAARLISGAEPSVVQGRLLAIVDEIARAGNIVLYIKNIEKISGISSGGEESLDLSDVLVSAIERKVLFCLASATEENYSKYIENRSLGACLAKIKIAEPDGNQAIQIIESKIAYYEGLYQVYFSYHAIEEVVNLSKKYIHEQYLPEKAISILETVAARTAKVKGKNSIVSKDDIAAAVGEITGIPVTKVTANEGKALLNLEDKIYERMVGQNEAVNMVAASLRRARTEMREGKRPIANFLFLGPTGVGKTELSKIISEVYFGNEKNMIRLDMSEYQNKEALEKMIGGSNGEKGYLTEAVHRAPFSLVLLDEIEKAHPDILNLFLQVMDDGRLTDGQGRTVDFTNCIIIATSNVGSVYIQEQVRAGTDIKEIRKVLVEEKLNQILRPELINRFDGVIVFEPLSMENVVQITKLMLNGIAKMLKAKGIEFEVEENGVRILAQQGFDPKFGARPLRRLLQEKIEDQIANKILANELVRRDTVVIDDNAQVTVKKGEEL
ncbi:MAG: ATP-dependent Clp protease ATP-binding subunit [bacterium]